MDFSGGRRIVVYSLDIGWSKFIADGDAGPRKRVAMKVVSWKILLYPNQIGRRECVGALDRAAPMQRYLIERGVSGSRILVDDPLATARRALACACMPAQLAFQRAGAMDISAH
ncbi:hypothetical protein BG57_10775 [Caballeronia grimmiae]|uniref:Uncharacterized protein n=2 Tax=Caballeronia grimmiae TaxID=1071679 RepID=A0A069P931_9BURK|nr:hypothetical protein BG57_10775 [Caballeronia grimmiae]